MSGSLKEFEKWWEEKLNMHWSHYDQGVCGLAWIAALEWIKSRTDGGCDFTSVEITDIVDEEIEEGEYATS